MLATNDIVTSLFDMFVYFFLGFDKWKVYKRETQSIDERKKGQNVDDVLCSTTAELVDQSTAEDGDTPQSKSL